MAVQARFYVSEVTRRAALPDGVAVVLLPSLKGGNSDWARYTPGGKLEMTVNGPAAAWFESHLAKDVAITFDEIQDPGIVDSE